jgi:protein-S-isoprenylcysteine O-methyltransferase Ste14
VGKIAAPMSLSTKARLLFWALLLVGGALLALYFDRNDPRLNSLSYHLITALASVPFFYLSFKAASIGGKTLARYGKTPNTPPLETNRLVTQGIYGCMRHPMLFGLALFPLAIALFLGIPSFIWPIAPLEGLLVILLTLTFEEQEAIRKFGEDYEEYRKRVKAFDFRCFFHYLFNS